MKMYLFTYILNAISETLKG